VGKSGQLCLFMKERCFQVLIVLFVFFLTRRNKQRISKAKRMQQIISKEANDHSSTIQRNYRLEANLAMMLIKVSQ